MAWRRCKSLVKLMEQINRAYPTRDTSSDGSIGDAAHASRSSSSDHNPWVKDGKMGVVTAQDIDEDLNGKGTLEDIVTAIRASRDKRVKYIIYEGRITVQGSELQTWKKYTGKNAHKQHAHISVFPEKKFYDDDSEWSIGVKKPATPGGAAKPELPVPAPPLAIPDPITPAPTEAVPVQMVTTPPEPTPEPPAQENTLTKIGNRFAGLWTAAGTAIVAAGTFLTSTPLGIAIAIIGSVALIGIGYMIINWRRAENKEKRDADERKAREDRDLAANLERERREHEIQMALINAAQDKDKNSVVLVPPPVELSNTESTEA